MKSLYLLVFTLLISGCAANKPKTGIFQHLSDPDSVSLQMAIEAGANINETDGEGRTLLHHAIRYAPHLVQPIIAAKPNLNIQDRSGITPLHTAVIHNAAFIAPLLMAGADSSLKTTSKLDCRIGTRKKLVIFETPLELANTCKRKDAIAEFNRFARDTVAWSNAEDTHSVAGYKFYLEQFDRPLFARQANQYIKQLKDQWIADTQAQSKCAMNESGWYFIKGPCKEGLAHGQGIAVTIDGEKFIGEFNNGWRLKGRYSQEGVIFYDGEYVEGTQHGYGVCRYQEKMEECRLYQGERIDTLFKQRENMQSEFQHLAGKMEQLRGAVAASNRTSSSGSNNRFSYIADLASDDDTTRTAAQVQAALDIFRVMIESAK